MQSEKTIGNLIPLGFSYHTRNMKGPGMTIKVPSISNNLFHNLLWSSQLSHEIGRGLSFLFSVWMQRYNEGQELAQRHWAISWWGWVKNSPHMSSHRLLFSKYYTFACFNQRLIFEKDMQYFLSCTHLRTFLTIKSWTD